MPTCVDQRAHQTQNQNGDSGRSVAPPEKHQAGNGEDEKEIVEKEALARAQFEMGMYPEAQENFTWIISINPADGSLTLVQQQTNGIVVPRNFAIDPTGAFCIVANMTGNNIVLFSINQQTGQLTPTGQSLSVSSPVCILPYLIQPPQPVLGSQAAASNAVSVNVSNSLDLLTYQLYQSSALTTNPAWNLLTTGNRGQTNFTLSNALARAFFRVGVLTNF